MRRFVRLTLVCLASTLLAACPGGFGFDIDEILDIENVAFEILASESASSGTAISELAVFRGETVTFDLVVTVATSYSRDDVQTMILTVSPNFGASSTSGTTISLGRQSISTRGDPRPGLRLAEVRQQYTMTFASDYILSRANLDFGINVRVPESPPGPEGDRQDGTRALLVAVLQRPAQDPTAVIPREVSAGQSHSLALTTDDRVWGWGNNDHNQLDELTGTAALAPVPIPIPEDVMHVSAGYRHSLALTDSGLVYAWGANESGQLGPDRTDAQPAPVAGIANALGVFAGNSASFAIVSRTGTLPAELELLAWGSNFGGQLGIADVDSTDTPTPVPVADVVKVVSGFSHTLALTANGEVYSWGEGRYGQLGDGQSSAENRTGAPALIPGFTDVIDIGATREASFLVRDNGQVIVFGRNENDIWSTTDPGQILIPRQLTPTNDTAAISAGGSSESIILQRVRNPMGESYYSVRGENGKGQLAYPVADVVTVPRAPDFPPTPWQLSMGGEHGLLVQRNGNCGAVWSWGSVADGRLGAGIELTGEAREVPQPVSGFGAADCAILTIATDNRGRITSVPGDIDCGDNCESNFNSGEAVTLDAGDTATEFLGFSGDCANDDGSLNTALPLLISMDDHKSCRASFSEMTGNLRPYAVFDTTPASPVMLGTEIAFDGTDSRDDDGSIISWDWDFDGDSTIDASGATATFTYPATGLYDATLTVTDDGGLSDAFTSPVEIVEMGDAAPTATFTITPASPITLGTRVVLDSSASFDDVGLLSQEWDFGDDGTVDSNFEIVGFTPISSGPVDIRLTVTDTIGQTGDDVQTLVVLDPAQTFTLRVLLTGSGQVTVTPPGVTLPDSTSCDGNECFVFGIAAGTDVSAVASAFTPAAFDGWDEMECDTVVAANNECMITMDSDKTITATFQ